MGTDLRDFVRESNRIEGITRPPLAREIAVHRDFLALETVTQADVEGFVYAVAGATLRTMPGMDVRVGNHRPPPGSPEIAERLSTLLDCINNALLTAYEAHRLYETLHPFMDGNGRSGRALWLWQMLKHGSDPYALRRGFLHTFYYQALGESRP